MKKRGNRQHRQFQQTALFNDQGQSEVVVTPSPQSDADQPEPPLTHDQELQIDHMVDDQGFIYYQARQVVLGY